MAKTSDIRVYKGINLLRKRYDDMMKVMSTHQKRTLNYIYHVVRETLKKGPPKDGWYEIDISEMFHQLDCHSGGNQTILVWDQLEDLVKVTFKLDYTTQDSEGNDVEREIITPVITLIDRPKIASGVLKVQVSEVIKSAITYKDGDLYRYISLEELKKLTGASIDIYELLKSSENMSVYQVDAQTLRATTGHLDKYPKWAHYEEKVIKKAQKEMANTDISFRYNVVRGRKQKPTAVKFFITRSGKKSKKYLEKPSHDELHQRLKDRGLERTEETNVPDESYEYALKTTKPDAPKEHIGQAAKTHDEDKFKDVASFEESSKFRGNRDRESTKKSMIENRKRSDPRADLDLYIEFLLKHKQRQETLLMLIRDRADWKSIDSEHSRRKIPSGKKVDDITHFLQIMAAQNPQSLDSVFDKLFQGDWLNYKFGT